MGEGDGTNGIRHLYYIRARLRKGEDDGCRGVVVEG
jgi:hypothetical protein